MLDDIGIFVAIKGLIRRGVESLPVTLEEVPTLVLVERPLTKACFTIRGSTAANGELIMFIPYSHLVQPYIEPGSLA